MLAWYTGLLQLRRTDPALRSGAYVPLESGNPKVLAYARRSASGAGILVLLNMSGERQALKITGWPGQAPRVGALVMASTPTGAPNVVDPVLEPYAAQLVRFGP
jgi:alpha-glucosidase